MRTPAILAVSFFMLCADSTVIASESLSVDIALEAGTRAPVLQVNGASGLSCRLEYADVLAGSAPWQLLTHRPLSATGAVAVDRATTGRTRFYRATHPTDETGLLLWLRFNGTLDGTDGERPLSHRGASYRPGQAGQAVYLDATGHIRYPISQNLESDEGTIEFWVQPDWDGTDTEVRVFLEAGDNFNRGLLISKDGASNLRFLQWGDDPGTPAVESDVERGLGFDGSHWRKGQWYHLAAAWRGTTRELAFYENGEVIRTAVNGVHLPSFGTSFLTIGAETDNARAAVAAFDELRIFSRMRTATQIWEDFLDPGGAPKNPDR